MTDEDLAKIRERNELAREAAPLGEMYLLSRAVEDMDALLAEIERLRAQNAVLREIAQALAAYKGTWTRGSLGESLTCGLCGLSVANQVGREFTYAEHTYDCPVTKARALLQHGEEE